MGRTVATYHQLIEQSRARFLKFRRALRREDQQAFDELFERAKFYAASGSFETAWNPLEAVFLSLLLDQQKELRRVRARLRALEDRKAGDDADDGLVVGPLPGA